MGKVGRPIGHRLDAETRKRIGDARRGIPRPDDVKEKIARSVRKHWNKVSRTKDKEITEVYNEGELRVADIAKMYHITPKHLYRIVQREEQENEKI